MPKQGMNKTNGRECASSSRLAGTSHTSFTLPIPILQRHLVPHGARSLLPAERSYVSPPRGCS